MNEHGTSKFKHEWNGVGVWHPVFKGKKKKNSYQRVSMCKRGEIEVSCNERKVENMNQRNLRLSYSYIMTANQGRNQNHRTKGEIVLENVDFNILLYKQIQG